MSGKDKNEEYFSLAPPKRSGWESFRIFLWNGETREFLGRTAASWGKIIGFYFILYSFLAAFFAAMFMVFLQTLDQAAPKWKQGDGLIGTNPGLGFRPMPKNVESTLIQFIPDRDKNESWSYYTQQLTDFLKPYETGESGAKSVNCDFDRSPRENEVCTFPVASLGASQKKNPSAKEHKCNKEDFFGYADKSPCIFLKLNKIFDWKPEPYNDIEKLRAEVEKNTTMTPTMFKVIEERAKENPKYLNMVWVECTGVNELDKENIGSPLNVKYTPYQGFPGFYFPYKKSPGYVSPIVAVQFTNLQLGVVITVECKAYAKNILIDRQRRLGLVKFELKVGE